jgi:hypothetical protein
MKTLKAIDRCKIDEIGYAAFFITFVIMIVLGLFVLGYTQISRSEQRASIDRQLSDQAFYSAETGVNDAIKALNAGYLTTNPSGKTTCGPSAPFTSYSIATNDAYTCLLINPIVKALKYPNISTDQSTVVPLSISKADGTPQVPASVTLSWQNQGSTGTPLTNYAGCPTSPTNPPIAYSGTYGAPIPTFWNSTTCSAPYLRVDVVNTNTLDGSAAASTNLENSNETIFFRPVAGGGSTTTIAYAGSTAPAEVPVNCRATGAAPNYCTVNITGLTSGDYLRVRSIYAGADLQVTANNNLYLKGAQALIDSTGEATDVIRRIQVQVPLAPSVTTTPDFAIQSSDTICKHFYIVDPAAGAVATLAPTVTGTNIPDQSTCFP